VIAAVLYAAAATIWPPPQTIRPAAPIAQPESV
jgi:hypothetical protein